jgi:elongator complex protein 2
VDLLAGLQAQSASVAEIWLWHIGSWRVAGQLRSHTLTVTQMEFSHNNRFLLSVSRDRHLSIYQRVETGYTSLPWFFVHCPETKSLICQLNLEISGRNFLVQSFSGILADIWTLSLVA